MSDQGNYLGPVELGDTLLFRFLTKASEVPTDGDATPACRVYGDDGFLVGVTPSQDTYTITNATNASPIVVTTSAVHNLATGMRVTQTGVGGNTNANGSFIITVLTTTTFQLNANGNAAYTSGGTGHISGYYKGSLAVTAGNGFESGRTYTILVECAISSSAKGLTLTFSVV